MTTNRGVHGYCSVEWVMRGIGLRYDENDISDDMTYVQKFCRYRDSKICTVVAASESGDARSHTLQTLDNE